MSDPRHIRIFLSSPGDVNEERALTRKVIDELHLEPLLRDKVSLQCIAWDDLSARTPMLATLTPQEAINRSLPKPSECHIVIVIFWSRMGTPLPDNYHKSDGSRYLSGTEWEYLDAIDGANQHAQKFPLVAVYRRTEKPQIDLSAPDVIERYQQYQLVDKFFEQFKSADGSLRGGINQYASPAEFQTFIENDLKMLITQVLESPENDPPQEAPATQTLPSIWQGSPFPGLRAFTADDEPIFFGRGRETDALVSRVKENRFVGVVGASGSGKSSLVGAGLIPRMRGNAIDGSKDWLILQFTPGEVGDDPFMALAVQLATVLKDRPRDIAEALKKSPDALAEHGERALSGKPDWAELLLFIDQFEELFTLVRPEFQAAFIALLADDQERAQHAAPLQSRIRIVVTMRSDFYHRCVDHPALTDLLERSTYPLSVPKPSSLSQMITRPAERAGLQFEHGLPERILDDTGIDPGALALMAYLLDELYVAGKGSGKLTFADYDALGGVQGAIGKRAEATFEKLDEVAQAQLKNVFRELVEVDEHGTATRRRSPYSKVAENDAARTLVDAFVEARLLVGSGEMKPLPKPLPISQAHGEGLKSSAGNNKTLEVAHEALLRSWPTLVEWIKDAAGDLYALRQARQAAKEWDAKGSPDYLLWPHERLQPVYDALENLESTPEAPLDAFIRPEAERLLDEFKGTRREDEQLRIIERWLQIGVSSTSQMMTALDFTTASNRLFGQNRHPPVADSIIKVLIWWNDVRRLVDGLQASGTARRQAAVEVLTAYGEPSMMSYVLPLLRDREQTVRQAALQVLKAHGEPSMMSHILPLLRDGEQTVRQAALQVLKAHGEPSMMSHVLPLLSDTSHYVRYAALQMLMAHGEASMISYVLPLLRDGEWNVQQAAVEMLTTHGDTSMMSHVLSLLHDRDSEVRQAALQVLRTHGDTSMMLHVLPLLRDADRTVRQAALQVLTAHGDTNMINEVLPLLHDKNILIQQEAVEMLTTHGDANMISHVLSLLGDANSNVRQAALQVLTVHGNTSMISHVLPLLHDANGDVRQAAVKVLTAHGDTSMISHVLPLLHDANGDVRQAALQVLTVHGDADILSDMLPLLHDANGDVRQAAVKVLTAHGDADILSDMLPLLHDGDSEVQQAALQVLTAHGNADMMSDVLPLLHDINSDVRRAALQVLTAHGNADMMSDVLPLLQDVDNNIRQAAVKMLTAHGDTNMINEVLPLLHDGKHDVRRAALQVLTALGETRMMNDVLPFLQDGNHDVRQATVEFIGKYGGEASIPHILPSLADPASNVRQAAFDALMKLSGRALPPS